MEHDAFWQLIDDARALAGRGADDRGAQDDPLPDALTTVLVERLSPDEILAFAAVADEVSAAAYAWPVWGAAYLIEGGCSDDGFMDFRDGLVLAGREVFSRTIVDPDSLAEHPVVVAMAGDEGWFGYESLDSLVGEAWAQATGGDDEEYHAAREATARSVDADADGPETVATSDPAGENWDFDDEDENRRRLPRLAALFG